MFAPMVESIFTNLAEPIEANDEQAVRDRQLLQRQYFQFIAAIVSNNLTEVLPAQTPALLNQVMQTIIQGSIEFPDPVVRDMIQQSLSIVHSP
jgi:exportin-T